MPVKDNPTRRQSWGSILTQRPDVNALSPQGFAGHLGAPSAHSEALPLPAQRPRYRLQRPACPRCAPRVGHRSRYRGNRGASSAPAGIICPRHFQTAPAPQPVFGGKEPAREAGSRAMRPRAEGAAAGAAGECGPRDVGPAGAAPSLPGRSPRLGPGTAGRAAARPREEVGPGGARRLRRLRFLRPFPSTPAREAAGGRSACWSCLIAPCPARHGRLCGPCRLASCFLMG